MFIQNIITMANTKEYSIKINGLQESINAVESLNKQLNTLDQKMKALSSAKASTGGGGSTKASAALSEEERVQKEINKLKEQGQQLDAKILAAQDEIYKRVDATKQLYKETIADQKALAAQERLSADAYSNTMQGMKSKLADLKAVINTTDLGDGDQIKKLTEEANKLTQALKEMEEAYGQFGRNVGNYKESLNGITVVVGGVERQFSSAKEAARSLRNELMYLTASEKGQTTYAKELRREYNKLKSAMEDATKQSKFLDQAMDAMQSFTALQQVTRGFSTFFGIDSSEIERQIAKLVALQNMLQGIQTIQKQIDAEEGLGKWLAKGSRQIDIFTAKLFGAQKRMGLFVAETKKASVAANMFSKAMKTFGGVALTGGIMLLTTVIGNLIEKFTQWATAGIEAGDATKILNTYVGALSSTSQRLISEKVDAYFSGIAGEASTANGILYEMTTNVLRLYNAMKLINDLDFKKFNNLDSLSFIGLNNIDDARSKFMSLAKEIETIEKKSKNSILGETISGWISGINGAKRSYKELGKAIADDFMARVEEATKKAQTEVIRFGYVQKETARYIEDLKNEMTENWATNSVLTNIEQFCDNSDIYVKAIESIKKSFNDLSNSITVTDVDKLAQLNIDASPDSEDKIRRQNELNRKREIKEAGFNPEYVEAINRKYKRELEENLKAYRKTKKQEADQKKSEDRAIQNEIDDYRLQLMNEGLAKELKALYNERDQKIREIEDSGKRVNERRRLALEVYQKKEKELIKNWAAEVKKIYEDLYNDIQGINRQTFNMEVENASSNKANKSNSKRDEADKTINAENRNNIYAMREYYAELLDIEKKAADDEASIQQERLDKELEYTKREEELRHQRLVDANDGEYKKQLEAGKLTQEQYDKLIEEENNAHAARMNAIDKEYAAKTTQVTQKQLDDKYKAYASYYQKTITLVRKKQDDIAEEIEAANAKVDIFGFFNPVKLQKAYTEAINKQKLLIQDIQQQMDKLNRDNKAGNIVGEEYDRQMSDLEASLKAALATLKKYEEDSRDVVGRFISQINQYVQAVGQAIQDVMQAVWDYQDYMLEKEQDELDKWNEKLDKALDKQQEIVEEHKDAIDSIEDELATSRGDRRQHLIDQLNEQIAAQRAAQKEEQKIQKQKEAAEKRQEQLDKKRRKEEYERNVTQAFISWHLSIANGLATQPFMPLGIAMGALATVLGAVQYALVKSQKPYAKGGQLDGGVAQGKRHSEGGIPVLGGRASIEGGEFITNRQTTAKNVDLLEYINSKKKKVDLDDLIDFYSTTPKKTIKSIRTRFADGGTIPTLPSQLDIQDQLQNIVVNQDNRPIVVSVVDINNKQDDVRRVQTLAGL